MCSICGVFHTTSPVLSTKEVDAMGRTMLRRGPDQQGHFISGGAALQHNRLAIIDVEHGLQPMTRTYKGCDYTIVYNGEIYNTPELTTELKALGVTPQTYCDTEIVLYCYILFGEKCAEKLNGIFAFAVLDSAKNQLCLVRDRFGIKPLFYAFDGQTLLFASEIKALLAYPSIQPKVNLEELWQLLFLSPAKLQGCGIFNGIRELLPAHYAIYNAEGFHMKPYWQLKAEPCTESRNDIIAHTKYLLKDAIDRQMVSDVPLCTLLSGGLDSSVISAVAAEYYKARGNILSTYSFEYEGNRENFHKSLFQPQSDDDYAIYLADWLHTDHHVLTAPTKAVADLLLDAVIARDMPGQADIDSSLLYFCQKIKKQHTVAISGECSDEIFGGYPWFYRPEMLSNPFFPWIHAPFARISLFQDSLVKSQQGYDYLCSQYQKDLALCPTLEQDSPSMVQSRRATWLSVNYFMASLLERKDRMSMANSVEIRVPFADHRILEYVFNVPWEVKFEEGVEKALLRNAMADYLPDKILHRKKSPYPKTQNPEYLQIVEQMLTDRLQKSYSPLASMLDQKKFQEFLAGGDATWFGQLMAKPQMIAWLVQFDFWADFYHVEFTW